MPDDYSYRMSDLEYKKYKLRQTIEGVNDDYTNPSGKAKNYQDYVP